MITSVPYKLFAQKIGNIFCENNSICAASVKNRLVNNFSNEGFEIFLENLSYGRTYSGEFKNYRVDNNTGRRYVDLFLEDLITGTVKKLTWNWLQTSGDFYNQLKSGLAAHGYEFTQGLPVFDSGNYKTKRIYHKQSDPNYGIVFVPGEVGSGGGGGNIIVSPPNIPVVLQTQQETKENSNILTDLPEWILPVGLAVGGYFLLKYLEII